MTRNTSVIGVYEDRTTVADALDVLHKAGYRATDISVLSSENRGSKDFAHEKRTKGMEGAAAGAVAGALLGAAAGWFLSIGTMTGFGQLVAGPVVGALAGAGVGGAVGWIAGLLVGMRRVEYVARRYAGRVRHGGILMSVHCDSPEWCARAKKTLKDTGARDISSAAEASADFGTSDKPTERAPAAAVMVEAPVERTPVSIEQDAK